MTDLKRKTNFVLQQGFEAPEPERGSLSYAGLLFQPRVIGVVVILGSLTQYAAIFAVLAAVLWWSAAFPRLNPFDAAYNQLFGSRAAFRLSTAPPPRRFAQALAGLLSLVIAVSLTIGQKFAAVAVEILFLAAIAALVFGGFCFGSYVFHVLRGRKGFANRTLPWSTPPNAT